MTDLHAKAAKKYNLAAICGLFGKSKQAYYQYDEDITLTVAASMLAASMSICSRTTASA